MSANEENTTENLTPDDKGQLSYQLSLTISRLSYFQYHWGRHVKQTLANVYNTVRNFGAFGLRLLYNLGGVRTNLKNEITSLLDELRSLPETTLFVWRNGDFLVPLQVLKQSYCDFFTVRKEFFKEWNYSVHNMQRAYYSPWSRWFKFYLGFVALLSFVTLYHYKLKPWPKHDVKNEINCLHRTVVITGASSGIGYRLAYEFMKRGAFVVITSPDMVKARKARVDLSRKLMRYIEKEHQRFMNNVQVRYYEQIELPYHLDIDYLLQNVVEVELNLSSMASIYSFTRKVQGMSPNGIDILINNAALNASPEEMVVTDEGKEAHFAVNYFGHFVLTNLLLIMLTKRKGARIINVTCRQAIEKGFINLDEFIGSYLEEEGLPFLPAHDGYVNSKLAMHLFSGQLAKELFLSGIYNVTSYSVCPGTTRTFLNRRILLTSVISRLRWSFAKGFYKKAFHAVQPILHCALSESCGQESGFFYENNRRVTINTRHSDPDEVAQNLWTASMKLMTVGHVSMLKLTEQMHIISNENIFQLAKDMFLHRRDVMTHLLLTEEKQTFFTRHKMYDKDVNRNVRKDFTYFWNGFYQSGGKNSSLIERWVLYNTHPGFRALQQEYDTWFECTGSAHFHPESSGKMSALQYMPSMSAPLTHEDLVELEQLYESDSEPDETGEDEDRHYPDFISLDNFI